MKKGNKTQIDDRLENDAEGAMPLKYSITSYGADFTVHDLVKQIQGGSIDVPSFHRSFVWDRKKASRFIESLLLDLPVPGIVLSVDEEPRNLLVIDGLNRLRTLQYFYEGRFAETGQVFALKGVHPEFENATYMSLPFGDRLQLDESLLHATIVKPEAPCGENTSIYHIFERLNTGGIALQPQEIRACIYHGEFNNLLNKLNKDASWRMIFGCPHKRMKDQEMILRFLALYFHGENYSEPMKDFLNTYMGKNRHFKLQSEKEIQQVFFETIEIVGKCFGESAFRQKTRIITAVFDAVMIGIAKRLSQGSLQDTKAVRRRYEALLNNRRFIAATTNHTTNKTNVEHRIKLAIEAFADMK
jgi:hypothetical protein